MILIKILLALFLSVFVLIFSVIVDYVGLLLESGENKRLKAENVVLKKQFDVVESNVKSLENSLERVKGFSTKLKLITDVDSKDRSLELELGKKAKEENQIHEMSMDDSNKEKIDNEIEGRDSFLGILPENAYKGELLRMNLSNYNVLSIRVKQDLKSTHLQEQGMMDLYNRLSKQNTLLQATPTVKPTQGWYTAKFGYNDDPFSGKPIMNQGIEIAAPEGSPIVAPADGVVSYVGYENNEGKVLMIDHGFGLKTLYAHNSQIFVEVGQKVVRSEMIAAVGSTGRAQNSHLYYEIRVHGVPVDPLNYILE